MTDHFQNPDGSITAYVYSTPVHYKDENGKWKEIDTRLFPIDDVLKNDTSQLKAKGFTHAVTENRFQVFTGQSSQSPLRVCMEDIWVELEPMNTRGVIGKIKLNKLTSQGLWLDADIAYSIREDGLKEEIILRDRGASNTYTFKLNLFGLKGKNLEDGSIGLYKETTVN